MDFGTAIRTCLQKYVTFEGRAPRSEFWFFVLFTVIGNIVLSIVDSIVFGIASNGFQPLSSLFGLAVLLPSIAVAVRRLHDTDRSGWWWWLCLVPLVGWIILIVWYATEGTKGSNSFGRDPLGDAGTMDDDSGSFASSSVPRVDRD